MLKGLTENDYTVHGLFSYASYVGKSNSNNLVATFDVERPFTNILLEETIKDLINGLFLMTDKVHIFERVEHKQLFTFGKYESFL